MRAAALLAVLAVGGCATDPPGSSAEEVTGMRLTSSAFEDGGTIPTPHTCDGEDVSPPLAWADVPDGTAAFALVVTDPDAGGFVHWLLTDIPGDARELPAGEGDAIGVPGQNDFRRAGWGGPCPPSGEHRYEFRLWALSEPIDGTARTAQAVRTAATRSSLASATLTGVYARNR